MHSARFFPEALWPHEFVDTELALSTVAARESLVVLLQTAGQDFAEVGMGLCCSTPHTLTWCPEPAVSCDEERLEQSSEAEVKQLIVSLPPASAFCGEFDRGRGPAAAPELPIAQVLLSGREKRLQLAKPSAQPSEGRLDVGRVLHDLPLPRREPRPPGPVESSDSSRHRRLAVGPWELCLVHHRQRRGMGPDARSRPALLRSEVCLQIPPSKSFSQTRYCSWSSFESWRIRLFGSSCSEKAPIYCLQSSARQIAPCRSSLLIDCFGEPSALARIVFGERPVFSSRKLLSLVDMRCVFVASSGLVAGGRCRARTLRSCCEEMEDSSARLSPVHFGEPATK